MTTECNQSGVRFSAPGRASSDGPIRRRDDHVRRAAACCSVRWSPERAPGEPGPAVSTIIAIRS